MSTSLLVSRMKEAAEARGLEVEIWAVAQDKAATEIKKADVLLSGSPDAIPDQKLLPGGGGPGDSHQSDRSDRLRPCGRRSRAE